MFPIVLRGLLRINTHGIIKLFLIFHLFAPSLLVLDVDICPNLVYIKHPGSLLIPHIPVKVGDNGIVFLV
jgi:hypothetical protein